MQEFRNTYTYLLRIYSFKYKHLPCPINILYNGYLNVSDKLEQLLEVGDTESSCRIPALGRVPESAWNNTRLDRISFDAYKEI